MLNEEGQVKVCQLDPKELPDYEIGLRIKYSGLNYKDALAITGKGKIVRSFPFIPGIDLCGSVVSPSQDEGTDMIATGWGIGEKYWGGLAEMARLKREWLTPLPQGMTCEQAMTVGTAGLTAMLCVAALRDRGIRTGRIVVSGASGGVGSFAVKLLAASGYEVTAITSQAGREFVTSLGASQCIMRDEFGSDCRPLETQKWAGAIDTTGGKILARMLAEVHYGGVVAACGLASDYRLNTTVMPFILRGVQLVGIDSVYVSAVRRQNLWQEISRTLSADFLRSISSCISLEQVAEFSEKLLRGETTGRIIVKLED